jgi:hypothetical protein
VTSSTGGSFLCCQIATFQALLLDERPVYSGWPRDG